MLLPAVATQTLLHRLADTDLQSQLAYQDRIAALHRRSRYFYYPYVVEEQPFTAADFGRLQRYQPRPFGGSMLWASLAVLMLVAAIALAAGLRSADRLRVVRSHVSTRALPSGTFRRATT